MKIMLRRREIYLLNETISLIDAGKNKKKRKHHRLINYCVKYMYLEESKIHVIVNVNSIYFI